MYELFTGTTPYVGKDPIEIVFQHVEGKPKPPREHAPDLPPTLKPLFSRRWPCNLTTGFRAWIPSARLSLHWLSEGVDDGTSRRLFAAWLRGVQTSIWPWVFPMLRLHGDLLPVRYRDLDAEELTSLLREIVTDSQWATFMAGHDLDFSYTQEGTGRFASICSGKHKA